MPTRTNYGWNKLDWGEAPIIPSGPNLKPSAMHMVLVLMAFDSREVCKTERQIAMVPSISLDALLELQVRVAQSGLYGCAASGPGTRIRFLKRLPCIVALGKLVVICWKRPLEVVLQIPRTCSIEAVTMSLKNMPQIYPNDPKYSLQNLSKIHGAGMFLCNPG